jgi:general secretion pathway protein G
MHPSITARGGRTSGFSLLEIMVVMSIIGLLMALVGPNLIRQRGKAEVQSASVQINQLGTALDSFRLDCGRYPGTQEGLNALRSKPPGLDRWDGPYINKDIPLDPWSRPYYYRSPGEGGRPYDLFSYGADGAPGGDADNRDITNS